MTRIQPHGSKQANCLFALGSVAQITGIKYATLLKRYHRGALRATKYSGLLFIDYKELTKLIDGKRFEDKKKTITTVINIPAQKNNEKE